jgi:hypothetical protein
MRRDAAIADRHLEVRLAARAWQRAGAIDDNARRTIDASFPDDRSRLGPAFRVLAFVFTSIAVGALLLLFGVAGRLEDAAGTLLLLFGAGLWVLTEVQLGPLRRSQGGTEAATGFLSIVFLLGGGGFTLGVEHLGSGEAVPLLLGIAVLLLGIATVHWGGAAWAAGATVCLFLLLAQAPLARLLWIAVALGSALPLLRKGDSGDLPPVHRRACHASLGVSLIGLYVALHLGSWDHRFVESLREVRVEERALPRVLAVLGTGLIPLGLLALGLRTRRTLLLNLGLALGIASLVTLRLYVHAAPPWVVLIVGGGCAVGVALGLRRFLDSGPGKERGGLTAEPLFEDPSKRAALEVVAAVAAWGPKGRPAPAEEFRGGGGRSGGGGATGGY